MKHIDLLIITNLPAFYKIKLYNKFSIHKRIFVIYTGNTAEERNEDFFSEKVDYDYKCLEGGSFSKMLLAIHLLFTFDYEELIIGGWDQLICWLYAFLSPYKKNACVVESSVFESKVKGIRAFMKYCFLKRISKVYACGIPHVQLVKQLGFRGIIVETGGCGILNYVPQPPYAEQSHIHNFLYVGRLAEVKNLQLLITVFNDLPELTLNIIGFGPLQSSLQKMANSNVVFIGAVENKHLINYYQSNDVFILPSKSEPWGLVVEEALNNGLPVLVSDKVGCSLDLVVHNEVGLVFQSDNAEALKRAINQILNVKFYNELRLNVSQMNFEERTIEQIKSYFS